MDDITYSVFDVRIHLANAFSRIIHEKGAIGEVFASRLAFGHVLYVFQIVHQAEVKPTIIFSKVLYI